MFFVSVQKYGVDTREYRRLVPGSCPADFLRLGFACSDVRREARPSFADAATSLAELQKLPQPALVTSTADLAPPWHRLDPVTVRNRSKHNPFTTVRWTRTKSLVLDSAEQRDSVHVRVLFNVILHLMILEGPYETLLELDCLVDF